MAKLTGIVASSRTRAVATFNAAMDPTTLTGGKRWTVTTPSGAQPGTVLDAVVQAGDQLVDLYLGTALSPTQVYTIEAIEAKDALGAALPQIDRTATCTGPNVDEAAAGWGQGLLPALLRVLGEELAALGGRPVTRLARDLADGDTVAFVESTLAFSTSGAFFAGGRRYTYTGKTDMGLTGLVVDATDGTTIARGAEVVCDVAAILPD